MKKQSARQNRSGGAPENPAFSISPDELREDIRRTKDSLDYALDNFNHVTDPVLIDYYSYTLKAAQIRYQFLLKQAKYLDLTSCN